MSKQADGGKARAESLSPDDRKRIASAASKARWDGEASKQVVYVIGPDVGPQKIGIAARPALRKQSLQGGNPARLKVSAAVDPGEFPAGKVEKRAHYILRDDRLVGEWFNVTADEAVKAIHQAVEDLRSGVPQPVTQGGATSVRSIRLPDTEWSRLEVEAKAAGLTINALVAKKLLAVPKVVPAPHPITKRLVEAERAAAKTVEPLPPANRLSKVAAAPPVVRLKGVWKAP